MEVIRAETYHRTQFKALRFGNDENKLGNERSTRSATYHRGMCRHHPGIPCLGLWSEMMVVQISSAPL